MSEAKYEQNRYRIVNSVLIQILDLDVEPVTIIISQYNYITQPSIKSWDGIGKWVLDVMPQANAHLSDSQLISPMHYTVE